SGINNPAGLAFDASANLFVAELNTGTIYKFTRTGTKTTFATGLNGPGGLAFDAAGNLFEGDSSGGTITKITPAGTKSTFASGLNGPGGLAFDSSGNLFEPDQFSGSIYKFTPAGTKTAFASGLNSPAGLAVQPGQLTNISTRLEVLTGNSVLIAGFIISGTDNKQVLVRSLGPTLTQFGVSGALADTTIELHNGAGAIIATNDNWKDTQQAAIMATGKAPPNDLESAILITLAPGNYSAIVRGKNGITGVALAEVYDLDQAVNATLTNISTRGFVDTGVNVMIGEIGRASCRERV